MVNELLNFVTNTLHKFLTGLPDLKPTSLLIIVFVFWASICSYIPSYLKTKRNIRTGFTRKSFHFLVFITVSVINIVLGFSGVCLFGIIISAFIFFALIRQRSSGLYLALARENDAPKSTCYVIIPYISTLIGGLSLSYFFPEYVVLGYLICGLADASGEVIGTLYGKHRFQVKFLNFHNSFKSIEGCTSVFLLSFIVYVLFCYYQLHSISLTMLGLICIASLLVTITEIITPKGFDNLTIQIIAVVVYVYLII